MRINVEDANARSLNELADIKKELKTSRAEVTVLEKRLVEKDETYRELLMSLSAEKAHLDENYEKLFNAYNEIENQLLITAAKNERGDTNRLMSPIRINGSMMASGNLLDQLGLIREETTVDDDIRSQETSSNANLMDQQLTVRKSLKPSAPKTIGVIREYLHITATVVKLHFPELYDVSSKWLIDTVKDSPFYLYHDLMMRYMRVLRQEKAEEEEAKSETVHKEVVQQSGWISRFRRLTQGKSKTSKANKLNTVELSKNNSASCQITM